MSRIVRLVVLPTVVGALIVVAGLAAYASALASSPGALDPSFGAGGKVTTPMGTGRAQVTAVAIDRRNNGRNSVKGPKIVAGGSASNGLNLDFAVARYNDDGTLDTTFGAGGKVLTPVGSGEDFAWAIALQHHDGKIVQAGYAYSGAFKQFALVRYDEDGSLDSTFGVGGKVLTAIGPGSAVARAVTIQGHKIIVGGYSSRCACDTSGTTSAAGAQDTLTLARYNEDGSLDASFGSGGIVTLGSVPSLTRGHGEVLVQEDDKIVIGGVFGVTFRDFEMLTVRFTNDGSLDPGFNGTGISVTDVGPGAALATALQSDSKIVQAGYTSSAGGRQDLTVIRHNADGTLDTGFGVNGRVVTFLAGTSAARGLAINEDGKIIAVGRAFTGVHLDFLVERYNADGSLDSTFNGSGIVTTDVGGANAGQAVALEHGRILAGGVSNDQFALVRYMDG